MGISRTLIRVFKRTALAAGLMLLGLAAACGGGDDGSDTGSLVPQRANIIGSVAAGEALEAIDLDLNRFLEMLTSDSDEDHDGLEGVFDIDQFRSGGLFGDVSRADFFGEITDDDDVEYFAALLHGSFDEAALIAELESLSGDNLVQRVYKGSTIYSLEDREDDEDEFDLSVLDGSIFVIGSGGAVNDIIDIKTGDADPASGTLMDAFNDLEGGLFGLVLKVPQDIANEADLGSFPGLGDLPISLDFISALDIVGLGGNLNNGSLDLVVTMDFTNQEAAESLEAFIGGIVTLASAFLQNPDTAGLLEGLEIDRDGSLLTIKIGIPVSDIPDLFGDLTSEENAETLGGGPPGAPETTVLRAAIGVAVPIEGNGIHVAEGQEVDYRSKPPTSGDHWARWVDCGWYPDGLPDEVITHNLEHSNIVVSYNFTNPAQVTELRQALEGVSQFGEWGVARSYDDISDGQVVLSAWGHRHVMDGVRAGEIGLFFETYAGNTGPERIAC